MTELHNLSLFVSALAKFLLMTGLGIGGAIALIAECCGWKIVPVKIVALGIEQVPGGQLATRSKRRSEAGREGNRQLLVAASDRATSPPRKEWRVG